MEYVHCHHFAVQSAYDVLKGVEFKSYTKPEILKFILTIFQSTKVSFPLVASNELVGNTTDKNMTRNTLAFDFNMVFPFLDDYLTFFYASILVCPPNPFRCYYVSIVLKFISHIKRNFLGFYQFLSFRIKKHTLNNMQNSSKYSLISFLYVTTYGPTFYYCESL